MRFNIDYLCAFGTFITHGNRFDGERGCLGNYMRQHCRGTLLFALPKLSCVSHKNKTPDANRYIFLPNIVVINGR